MHTDPLRLRCEWPRGCGLGGFLPGLEGKTGYRRKRTKEATKPVPPSWVWIWEDSGPSDTFPMFQLLGSLLEGALDGSLRLP